MESRRTGFNSSDFATTASTSLKSRTSSASSTECGAPPSVNHPLRHKLYYLLDNSVLYFMLFFLATVDFILFLIFFVYLLHPPTPSRFNRLYQIGDIFITSVLLIFSHIRLFIFQPSNFFCNPLHFLSYASILIPTLLLLLSSFLSTSLLLIFRPLRQLHTLFLCLSLLRAHLNHAARTELAHLCTLLDLQQSQLDHWRLPSPLLTLGPHVANGAFGAVQLALFRSTLVALKRVKEGDIVDVEDEAAMLASLRHPNVVLFMGFATLPHLGTCIVTEYCAGGSVQDLISDGETWRLRGGRLLRVALGAARGLAYLHGKTPPVLHLDVKPGNVLLNAGGEAKLADFGMSRRIDAIENDEFEGTVQYAAPEVLEHNEFGVAADIYALGVCMWEMAAGENAFEGKDDWEVLWQVVKERKRPNVDILYTDMEQDDQEFSLPAQAVMQEEMEKKVKSQSNKAFESKSATFSYGGSIKRTSHTDESGRMDLVGEYKELGIHKANRKKKKNKEARREWTEGRSQEGIGAHVEGNQESRRRDLDKRKTKRREKHVRKEEQGRSLEEMEEGVSCKDDESSSEPRSAPLRRKSSKNMYATSNGTHLNNLRKKMTATIQKFDDRPPGIKPRYSKGGGKDEGNSEDDEEVDGRGGNEASMKPGLSNYLRNAFRGRNDSTKVSKNGDEYYDTKFGNSNGAVDASEDPFERRLEKFSNQAPSKRRSGACKSAQELDGRVECTKLQRDSKRENSKKLADKLRVPQGYVDLIQRCWAQDPCERPSASEVVWRLVLLMDGERIENASND